MNSCKMPFQSFKCWYEYKRYEYLARLRCFTHVLINKIFVIDMRNITIIICSIISIYCPSLLCNFAYYNHELGVENKVDKYIYQRDAKYESFLSHSGVNDFLMLSLFRTRPYWQPGLNTNTYLIHSKLDEFLW